MKVFLVEDEMHVRDMILDFITQHKKLQLEGFAGSAEEAQEKMKKKKIDLLFLDIHLPGMSGIELIDKLDSLPYLIFTTASNSHAVQAFELGAVDYLHKPFSRERFDKAVDRALLFLANEKKEKNTFMHITIHEGEDHHILPAKEIIFLSADDKHTIVHTESRNYRISKLLAEVEKKMPSKHFMRIHRSHIINTDYISRAQYLIGGRYQVFLNDEDETSLTVSRQYSTAFKDKFLN